MLSSNISVYKDKTRALHEDSYTKGQKKALKVTKVKVQEVSSLDREETAFATNEAGEPIYVSEENGENGEVWDFVDLIGYDREDENTGFTISDEGPSDFIIEVGQYNGGQAATDHLAAMANASAKVEQEEDEQVDEANFLVENNNGSLVEDMAQLELDDVDAAEAEVMKEINNEPISIATYLHSEPDTEEDMDQLEADESDLIVDDGTHLSPSEDPYQLSSRLMEAEIQLDTLLELSETVAELQDKLDQALGLIEHQERIISALTITLDPSNGLGDAVEVNNHITDLHFEPNDEGAP